MSLSPNLGFTLEKPTIPVPRANIYRDTVVVSKSFDLSIPAFVNC